MENGKDAVKAEEKTDAVVNEVKDDDKPADITPKETEPDTQLLNKVKNQIEVCVDVAYIHLLYFFFYNSVINGNHYHTNRYFQPIACSSMSVCVSVFLSLSIYMYVSSEYMCTWPFSPGPPVILI